MTSIPVLSNISKDYGDLYLLQGQSVGTQGYGSIICSGDLNFTGISATAGTFTTITSNNSSNKIFNVPNLSAGSDFLISRTSIDTLTNKTATDISNNIYAKGIITTSGSLVTMNASTPTAGQVFTAITSSTFGWTNPLIESNISHLNIQNIGTNTHAQIDTHIANTSNPHATTLQQLRITTAVGDILVDNGTIITKLSTNSINGQVLTVDSGSAVGLSWVTPVTSVTTLSAIGSSPNANGATITGNTLNLQPASAAFGGVITTLAQTFAGAKTFSNTPIFASNSIQINDSGSGNSITISTPSLTTTFTLTLPTSDGLSGQVMQTDGLGVLSFVSNGGISLAAVGSSPNANAATLASNVLTLQPADGSNPGVITAGSQTLGGVKTFSSSVTFSSNIKLEDPGGGANTVTLTSPTPLSSSYTLTMPTGTGTSGQVMITDGTGVLSFASSGGLSLAAVGSSPNANAATLSSNTLNLQPADGTNPGVITAGSQILGGAKTFNSLPLFVLGAQYRDPALGGTNAIMITSPTPLASSFTLTLPPTTGSAGQVLQTDGSGNLSFTSSPSVTTPLSSITAATTTNTIDSLTNAQIWGWSTATTQSVFTMTGNSLTSGNLLSLTSSSVVLTGSALLVSSASTAAATNGLIRFNFSGAHTGNGLQIDDITLTGNAMQINANSLTSGKAMNILTTATGLTGSLANLSITSSNVGNTGNLLLLTQSGALNAVIPLNISNVGTGATISATSNGTVFVITSAGQLGVGTSTPSSILSASGQVTQIFGLERNATANTAGNSLTINASGATLAATDKAGGNLILSSGISTGTGNSRVLIQTYKAASSGTSDNSAINIVTFNPTNTSFNPHGTTAGNTCELRFLELLANGSNYVGFKGADLIAGNVIWSLPAADGTSGQVLQTNGSSVLSWTSTPTVTVPLSSITAATTTNTIDSLTNAQIWNWSTASTQNPFTMTGDGLISGNLLSLTSSSAGLTGSAFLVSSASTAASTNGLIRFNFSGAHTGNGVQIDDITQTGNAMQINANSLTSGKAMNILSTATGLTGSLANLSITSSNAGNTGNLLLLTQSGALNAVIPLNISNVGTGATISATSNGTAFVITSAGRLGVGTSAPSSILSASGQVAQTFGLERNATADTAGNSLTINASGATLAATDKNGGNLILSSGISTGTGNSSVLINIYKAGTTGTADNPSVNIVTFDGSFQSLNPHGTSAGNTCELRFLELAANGSNYVGFKGADLIAGNVIWTLPAADGTSGQILTTNGSSVLSWSSQPTITVPLSSITAATTTNTIDSLNFAQIWGWSTASTQNPFTMTGNALTSGNLLSLTSSSTGLTGSALLVSSASTAASTNGLVRYNFTGNHTGNAFQIDDVTQTGTAFALNVNSLSSGKGLIITSNIDTTGNLLNVNTTTSGAVSNGIVLFSFQGDHTTGNGLSIIDQTSAATGVRINVPQLTSGSGLIITSSNTTTTGNMLLVSTASTSTASNGLVRFTLTGAHGAVGFQIDDATVTGTAQSIIASSLTSGIGLNISASNTAMTGHALLVSASSTSSATNGIVRFNFTGAHTNNGIQLDSATATGTAFALNANSLTTGTGLKITSNTNLTGKIMSVTSSTTGVVTGGLVNFTFSGNHTGSGFQIDENIQTGTAVLLNANSLTTGSGETINVNSITSGTGLSIASTATAMTGNMQSITLSGSNAANVGNLLNINSSGVLSAAVGAFITCGNVANGDNIILKSGSNSGASNQNYISFQRADGTQTGKVQQDSSTSVAYYTTSDERIKKDIKPLKNKLKLIENIVPINFRYKDDPNESTKRFGFSAQNLDTILPQLVDKSNSEIWMVSQDQIVPILVSCIKELYEMIKELKKEK